MTKVHIISSNEPGDFQYSVNMFIADKEVIDIKYKTLAVTTKINSNGVPLKIDIVDRCMIIYKEKENE